MKILVFAHQLEIGGTQVCAIQLTAALRDLHGHDVVLFATPGPAVKLAEQNGLRYLPAPDAFVHPSPARMRALREAVRHEKPDLIHVWDWFQCLDAYYIEHLLMRVPVLVTDMMMILTRVLPKALLTTFGIPELVDQPKPRAAAERNFSCRRWMFRGMRRTQSIHNLFAIVAASTIATSRSFRSRGSINP